MSILSTSRGARRGIFSAIAIGAALAVVTPMAANAAPFISRAEGRLLVATLAGQEITAIANLAGAVAELDYAEPAPEISNVPLDATALSLINVQLPVTNLNLFSTNVIQLGAVGQYAQANADGSSFAFSGTATAANSLIGINTVTPGSTTPAPGGSASINVGTAAILGGDDLVSLGINIGAVAASANQAPANDGTGAQTGDYVLADVDITVGGTVLAPVLGSLSGPVGTLVNAVNALFATGIVNPISGTSIVVTDDSLISAAQLLYPGVTSLNDLPEGTDLLQLIPSAIVLQLTATVNSVLGALANFDTGNGITNGLIDALVLAATPALNLVLGGLAGALNGPLGGAITALAQLTVNNQTNNPDGSFTQNAITLGVGPAGAIATVELANATVGPNAGIEGVPIANTESLLIAGGIAVAAAGVIGLVLVRRRRILGAGADV